MAALIGLPIVRGLARLPCHVGRPGAIVLAAIGVGSLGVRARRQRTLP
jgi:hypothetical protein